MKAYHEIQHAVLSPLKTKEQALTLVFTWVKTGVITKNQFIAIMTEMESASYYPF